MGPAADRRGAARAAELNLTGAAKSPMAPTAPAAPTAPLAPPPPIPPPQP